MLPVLYHFTFDSPLARAMLYAFAALFIVAIARNGWLGAEGAPGPDGKPRTPTADERRNRAVMFAVIGTVVAFVGLYYALPEVAVLGKGKGEGIPIHTYGILVGSGFITAVTAASWLAAKEWPGALGLARRDQILDMAFYQFIGGIVGSRVLYEIVNYKEFLASPRIFGGLVFQGGLIGAAVVTWWYCKKNGINLLQLFDIELPTVSLGIAFGRLGCFSAGCCWGKIRDASATLAVHFPGLGQVKTLFGTPGDTASMAFSSMSDPRTETRWLVESTGEVFADQVPGAVRVADWVQQHGHTLPIHPTQLYESAAQLALFLIFVSLRRFRRFHGQIAALWLMVYSFERSTVELFRGDFERGTLAGLLKSAGIDAIAPTAWYNISTSQLGSMAIFAFGAWLLARQFRQFKAVAPVAA